MVYGPAASHSDARKETCRLPCRRRPYFSAIRSDLAMALRLLFIMSIVRSLLLSLVFLLPSACASFGEDENQTETPKPAPASPPATGSAAGSRPDLRESVCRLIESAARAHDLPLEFFARVIWQESRFRADAVGPRTRSGDSAQGIAQFMPRTAAERGLLDPFDPVQALPKSAEF